VAKPKYRVSRRGPKPPVVPRSDVGIQDVVRRLSELGKAVDEGLLASAFEFAEEMHRDQVRRSGEPYLNHPMQVAFILADLKLDQTCAAVGLLHDVLEDTRATPADLERRFGAEIAALVDGVTKIGRHEYVRRDEAQAETFRKLVLASAKDIRVILVKLADRYHNMLTLEHMPTESRRRIAQETLEIYAPIAHRLGMAKLQGDLEDLAFFHLYPHQFTALQKTLQEKLKVGRGGTDKIRSRLASILEEAGLEAEIGSRVKRYYSIYRKLRRQGIDISELFDYLAFRIITREVRDCYAALGVVHQAWRPVPGRFKDYIAMPKPNLYQALHTTLVGEAGQPFEVQIRTIEMDLIAEEGIAAHWRYKQSDDVRIEGEADTDSHVPWLRQLLEWQQEVPDPRSFMTALKIDLFPDEVYVFTPKGDALSFPRGATPLDFAYRVHTELGHHCVGARINGKLVPLRSELRNGDMVEIVTSANRYPSRDWLNFVKTSRAKSKIRNWLNTEQNKRSMEIGRRLVERELKRYPVNMKKLLETDELGRYLEGEGISRPEDLFSKIGFGKLQARQVLRRVLGEEQGDEEEPGRIRQAVNRILPFGTSPIEVTGQGDLLAYLAKCCSPLPGDEIVGYVTRGRGVSVHSVDCPNVRKLIYNPEREIEVTWARAGGGRYTVVLEIRTEDRPGMLARLTDVIARVDSDIRQIEADTKEAGRGLISVVVEVKNRRHLDKLRQALRGVDGVLDVNRKLGATGAAEPHA
jgi:GTP pyrophosphokinase